MRILLCDDDQLIRDSFEVILKDAGFRVVGKVADGQAALDFLKRDTADLVLMDIRMPVMDGITATSLIKKQYDSVKVIMLTTFRDFKHVHQSLHAGASGYVLKTDSIALQIDTIRAVFEGKSIISEDALKNYTKSKSDQLLTERENSCMELIAHGYSNKEIAGRLFIGEGTVRNVISVILSKLDLRDRTQIAIYYWQTQYEGSLKN